ncbi:LamG domain-containing protein [Niabella sp. 22666]|uniref:LamG domain-containing protein n=1 Tax=Niabella sp. 22666 TaxID=3453954 RepID=UPI003F831368
MKRAFKFFSQYQSHYIIGCISVLFFLMFRVSSLHAQNLNDSLLLYLPFNGNANDASGNGNNGVISNATPATDRLGVANSAYDFNGTNSYIEMAPSASLSKIYTANEVTIAAWINIRNWYNNWNVFAVFEQYDPATDWGSVLLEANWASGGILFESGYNTSYIGCNYAWSFNEWHHLAVTYSKLTDIARFYVDGHLLEAKEYREAFSPDHVNSYAIGRSLSGPDEYSDGKIDEVRIYNRALSDAELMTLPSVGAAGLPVTFGAATAIVKDKTLLVNFTCLTEKNNDHFIIEASSDGKKFKEIGTVKSTSGDSDLPASYSFSMDITGLGITGLGLLGILLLPLRNKCRYRLAITMFVSAVIFVSCTRSLADIQPDSHSNIYIRITQVDKDGVTASSKTIQAVVH